MTYFKQSLKHVIGPGVTFVVNVVRFLYIGSVNILSIKRKEKKYIYIFIIFNSFDAPVIPVGNVCA